ncbi:MULTISPECIES: nuclear transport factor 2 family protein [unclassified Streptomyces]|jgi:carboxymethylenebutenolidase|uniref:nuclear transport factor 2 family protein n=1 Tax=unclassified Streptomyces TaxID=2593676 RepID=UPI001F318CC6|nr:nuclear transport factor 2 family protein [Streptomyces sp. Y2F8-2]
MADRATMERIWEAHTAGEFVAQDVEATMATMDDDPIVVHVPTAMGGSGYDGVKDFYARWFIGRNPDDFTVRSISRTVGDDSLVDEMIVSFTHDIEVPWILPGLAPTGQQVRIPVIAVVDFRGPRVRSERIYWDQTAVLAQTQLLNDDIVRRLPVVTTPLDVLDGRVPLNQLTSPRLDVEP